MRSGSREIGEALDSIADLHKTPSPSFNGKSPKTTPNGILMKNQGYSLPTHANTPGTRSNAKGQMAALYTSLPT